MKKYQYTKPMLAAAAVFIIWGFSFLFSTMGQSVASPLVLVMYRFIIASVLLSVPLIFGKKKFSLKGKNVKGLILLCVCEPMLYFIGEQYGLKYTNSSFSGIMIAISPIATLLLAAVVLKEKPTMLQWIFSVISILGVIAITLITSASDGAIQPVGVFFLIVAVICAAGYSVMSRKTSDDFTVFERTLFMQYMGAAFYIVAAAVQHRGDLSALVTPLLEVDFIIAALFLGVGASVIGYSLFNYAVAEMPMANMTAMNNLVTVVSVAAGVLILKEPFSFKAAIAMLVVLIGIYGVQRFGRKE